ncbi:MAG: hypothetical protein QOK58_08765 [Nitrososphaeraceae archaeon]|nr:hypothetical protein [Nitrososphaeraceae archaeon]
MVNWKYERKKYSTEKSCCDEIEIFLCSDLIYDLNLGPGGTCDDIGANT